MSDYHTAAHASSGMAALRAAAARGAYLALAQPIPQAAAQQACQLISAASHAQRIRVFHMQLGQQLQLPDAHKLLLPWLLSRRRQPLPWLLLQRLPPLTGRARLDLLPAVQLLLLLQLLLPLQQLLIQAISAAG
jgi:hypothetical protein